MKLKFRKVILDSDNDQTGFQMLLNMTNFHPVKRSSTHAYVQ